MEHDAEHSSRMAKSHYGRFGLMLLLSLLAMYVLMYAMVNEAANALPNFNQFYMAGLMVAPMALIELLLMRAMYPNRILNTVIVAISVVALAGFWLGIRHQVAINDTQFLQSMIPHHAGAILMCERASIQRPEVKELCRAIITNQRSEIDQMKAILNRDDR